MRATPEEILFHAKEYLEALQEKISHNPSLMKDVQDDFNEFNQYLTFVMKKQNKYDPKTGFDTSDKVGQGVAAMPKKTNVLFGVYARFILTRIREIVNENQVPMLIATHDSDTELSDKVAALS